MVSPFESVKEFVEDRSNFGENGVDISSRVVRWGGIGYAKTISTQQCGGEREESRRTNGAHRGLEERGSGAGMARARVAQEMREKRAILERESMSESQSRRASGEQVETEQHLPNLT